MLIEVLFQDLTHYVGNIVEVEGYLHSISSGDGLLSLSSSDMLLVLAIESSLKDFVSAFEGRLGRFDSHLLTSSEGLKVTLKALLHDRDSSHIAPYLSDVYEIDAWIPIPELSTYLQDGAYRHHIMLKYDKEFLQGDERLKDWPKKGIAETDIYFVLGSDSQLSQPIVVPKQTTIDDLLAQGLLNQIITIQGNLSYPFNDYHYHLLIDDPLYKGQTLELVDLTSPIFGGIVELCVRMYIGGKPYPQKAIITGRLVRRFDVEEEMTRAGYLIGSGIYNLTDLKTVQFTYYHLIDLKEK